MSPPVPQVFAGRSAALAAGAVQDPRPLAPAGRTIDRVPAAHLHDGRESDHESDPAAYVLETAPCSACAISRWCFTVGSRLSISFLRPGSIGPSLVAARRSTTF